MSLRSLFGGAITTVTRPDLLDASDMRQIPDNQEVFSYPDSNVSVIVEVLEAVEPTNPHDAIRFHFDSLAHDNDAISHDVVDVTTIPNDRGDDDRMPSAIVLSGIQSVPKFNRSTPDEVRIFMALFRVAWKNADLVVSFNVPTRPAEGKGVTQEQFDAAQSDFDIFIRKLAIVDDRLFG